MWLFTVVKFKISFHKNDVHIRMHNRGLLLLESAVTKVRDGAQASACRHDYK